MEDSGSALDFLKSHLQCRWIAKIVDIEANFRKAISTLLNNKSMTNISNNSVNNRELCSVCKSGDQVAGNLRVFLSHRSGSFY